MRPGADHRRVKLRQRVQLSLVARAATGSANMAPMRSPLPIAIVAALTISAAACGDSGKKDDGKVAKAEPEEKKEPEGKEAWKLDVGKADEAKADEGAAEDAKADDGAAEAANEEGPAEAGAAEGEGEGEAEAEAGAAEAEAGAAEGEAAEAGAPDAAALMAEAKNKKTKDDRALAALAEAEAAGAKPNALAKAAKARGDALHDAPDRAKTFYEWANEKDPKYPDAAFALAKQAVNLGEIEETKKWLKIVHERKGKKLLQQLSFDPMWEIVADDPEVKGWYDG